MQITWYVYNKQTPHAISKPVLVILFCDFHRYISPSGIFRTLLDINKSKQFILATSRSTSSEISSYIHYFSQKCLAIKLPEFNSRPEVHGF